MSLLMERLCQAQLMAQAVGNPTPISPDIASLTYSQVGSHYMGFQPLDEMIVRQQPDLLD